MSVATAPTPPPLAFLHLPSTPDSSSRMPTSLCPSPRSPGLAGPTSPGRSSSTGPNFLFPSSPTTPSSSTNTTAESHATAPPPLPNFSRPSKPSSSRKGSAHDQLPAQTPLSPTRPPVWASPPPSPNVAKTQASPHRSSPPRLKTSKSILQRLPTFLRRTTMDRSKSTPVVPPVQVPASSSKAKRASRVFNLPALRSPTSPTAEKTYVSKPEHRLLAQSLLSATPVGGGLGLGGEGPAPGGVARMEGWRRSVIPPAAMVLDGWSMEEKGGEEERVEDVITERRTGAADGWKFPASPTTPSTIREEEGPSRRVYAAHQHTREYSSSTPNLHDDHLIVEPQTLQTAISLTRHTTAPSNLPSFLVTSTPPNHFQHSRSTPPPLTSTPAPPPPSPPTSPQPRASTSSSARAKLHRLTTFFEPTAKRRGRADQREEKREGLGDRLVVHSPEMISRMVREWEVDEDDEDGDRKRMESFFM